MGGREGGLKGERQRQKQNQRRGERGNKITADSTISHKFNLRQEGEREREETVPRLWKNKVDAFLLSLLFLFCKSQQVD